MAFVEIDISSALPIWVQIRNRIAYLIESGQCSAGDPLPPIRELAADLGINYHTCSKAYTMLECDGYVTSRRGRGTVVAEDFKPDSTRPASDVMIQECIDRCSDLGMSLDDIKERFASVLEENTKRRNSQPDNANTAALGEVLP